MAPTPTATPPSTLTPTPTSTGANKRGRQGDSPPQTDIPLVAHGATMRTPHQPRQKPPRTPASQRGNGATERASATPPSTAERLVDELSDKPPHGANDNLEAFESARKKFAMYGKQNAHVSHYLSPDQHQAMLARNRQRAQKRQAQGAAVNTASPLARRSVRWDESESTGTNAAVLQNTVLLQENGELAAQLDDMEYHLDGILSVPSVETEDHGFAMAASVVALTKLLQLDHVQTVLKVASQSQQLNTRLRAVLLTLRTSTHRLFKLSVAVMAYLLTVNADADDFFSDDVIDTIVAALAIECRRLKGDTAESERRDSGNASSVMHAPSVESKTPLKKSFLKRKKSGSALVRRGPVAALETDAFAPPKDRDDGDNVERVRASGQREEQLRGKLCALLAGHVVFLVDGQIQLSTADLLCMLLHNILQVGGASGGEEVTESGSFRQTGQHQPVPRFHQRQDLAGTTFKTIRTRKQQLARNGGLGLLVQMLEKRFDRLRQDLGDDLVHVSVSLDVACAFQRVRTMLRVLDQASFLATDVQVQMSKEETVFRVTLELVVVLSTLAWSVESRKKWQSDPSFMHLVVDVLMAAMRVLINLSHQNEDANRHIATLDGTRILFFAFCKLWGTVQVDGSASIAEDRVVYDALLLTLSAITNCVEYSPDNRAQLSTLDLSTMPVDGLAAFRASSPCSLLVAFFVSKVQSYIHLFEMSDSQREMEDASWVPEDVVLGGCASLLLGCLMKDSSFNSAIILGALPDASPQLLLRALSAFVALHSQIGALTPEVGKSVLEVEKVLRSFMADCGEPIPSPAQSLVLSASDAGCSTESTTFQAEITLKVTAMSQRQPRFEVEEVKGEADAEDSQLCVESQQAVRSPPASAFKLQRFSRVCSNVDDSDDVLSDVDPSPVKKKRVATPPPKSPARSPARTNPPKSPARSLVRTLLTANSPSRSPARAHLPKSPARSLVRTLLTASSPARSPASTKLTVMNATVTFTPMRRVSDSAVATDNRGGDVEDHDVTSSIQHRLKRTRQLVSDLEAEFMKIGSRVSSEISASAVMMTSTEDDGDDRNDGDRRIDLAHNLLSNQDESATKRTPQFGKEMPQPERAIPQLENGPHQLMNDTPPKAATKNVLDALLRTPKESSPLRKRGHTPTTSRTSRESSPLRKRAQTQVTRTPNASSPLRKSEQSPAPSGTPKTSSPSRKRDQTPAPSRIPNTSSPLRNRKQTPALHGTPNTNSPMRKREQTTATSKRPAKAQTSSTQKRRAKAAPPTIIRQVTANKGAADDIFAFDG